MPPLADFGVGLFVGVILGAILYYVCADWLGCFQARTDAQLDRAWSLDDRPLAMRSPWPRLVAAIRTGPGVPAVPVVRPRVAGVDAHAGDGPSPVAVTTPEQAFADREAERRARFVRDLHTKGYEINELRIERR